jgi:signal transduction histidine kinase
LLLVLLAVLPALGLVGLSAAQNRSTLAREVRENAFRLARLTASGHDAAIEGARQLLTGLARAPEIRSSGSARCGSLLADLLERFPSYANFGVVSLDGVITCSGVPAQGSVNVADRTWFRDAVRTLAFAVGEYQVGRVTRQQTLDFGFPVVDGSGHLTAVMFAALSLRTFEDVATLADLPRGSTVIVVDAKGVILSRTPEPERFVGEPIPESALARALAAHPDGTAEVSGVDGVHRIYGFTRLQGGPVSLAVGIPTETAFADVNHVFWQNLIGLAVVGALALTAAWFVGTVFVERPVTGAIQIERESVQRLEQVDQLRSDFVSMVSHELRNPLATIRGFGQLLRDRPETLDDEQRRQAYDVIVREVDRMASLVENVLDVSRMESDTFSYAFIPYEPRRLLDECVAETRASWPGRRIDLDAPAAFPSAMGDPDRLKQVVLNLISNACRYSPSDRSVTVRGSPDEREYRLDVIDRGAGIAPESIGVLFQRFARIRTPDTAKVRGTGLGLYISRRIVEAHGGRIWVESEPGAGSTFSVTLPLVPERGDGA